MKVSLVYYTGQGHTDALFAARLLAYTKNTRLQQGDEGLTKFLTMPVADLMKEIDYISKTIRSSWEFIDFHFQITGVTRAFTHQLVRTRTGSFAQQSQRSVDLSGFGFTTPPTIEADEGATQAWFDCMAMINEAYKDMIEIGIPAQDARGVLPTNVHTNIIAKFNLRTLADLVGKRENLRATGEYADVVRGMKGEVLRVMPWVAPFLNPERTSTPALDEILRGLLGTSSPIDKPRINEALKELDSLKAVWG